MRVPGRFGQPVIFFSPSGKSGGSDRIKTEGLPGAKPKNISAQASLRDSVRQMLIDVVYQMRNGCRPSLVGLIPGLTQKMEEHFRSGQIRVIKVPYTSEEIYRIERVFGSDTIFGVTWSVLGLKKNPPLEVKRSIIEAYDSWKEHEIGFPEGDMAAAQVDLSREFILPYGITIEGASTAGELYYVMEILRLLPENVLRSGVIKCIDLKGARTGASRFGQYDEERKAIDLMDCYSIWDRHLVTSWLLHELGHPLYQVLSPFQKARLDALFESCWRNGAVIGTDFLGMSKDTRINYQSEEEFFAENFMHFIILGEKGMSANPLHQEIYCFYSEILPPLLLNNSDK